jgi:hypothetical protein
MSFDTLYTMLQSRTTPEDVAAEIEKLLPLIGSEKQTLAQASRRRYRWSMKDDFHRPQTKIERQLALVPVLFGVSKPSIDVLETIAALRQSLGLVDGKVFLNKKERRRIGIFKNARWYNKRRMLLNRLERKYHSFQANEQLYLFTRISKAALSVEIPRELFDADLNTAALVTYLAARMNRRSVFTNQSQDRAFDTVAAMLLKRCEASSTTRWFAVAHLLPDEAVLARLTEQEKGYLVGRWYSLLLQMAVRLETIWSKSKFDRLRMIVKRGDDSSTWNAIAGAWNIARSHWVSLVYAISGTAILDAVCPGKVMRLMAADVARWHQSSGGDVHPDTAAWAALPPPWDVLTGKAPCGLRLIQYTCDQTKASYESWTYRKDRKPVAFKPTPELVHGVTVSSPELASVLRKAGVFSGKAITGPLPTFDVIRDEHGAALSAVLGSSK